MIVNRSKVLAGCLHRVPICSARVSLVKRRVLSTVVTSAARTEEDSSVANYNARYERALHTALMGSYHKPIPSQDNSLQDLDPSNFGYRFASTDEISQRSERPLYTTTETKKTVEYDQDYNDVSDTMTCCTQWDRNVHAPTSAFSNLGRLALDESPTEKTAHN